MAKQRAPRGVLALSEFALGGLLLGLALASMVGPAAAAETESSIIAPLASRSLLLDGVAVGGLMVAVGERGHVLLSHDQGRSWQQRVVPTRATLTGVHFHDAKLGWAVGHDAVILRTRDGGQSWERVHHAPDEQRPLLDVWFHDAENGFAVGAYGYFLATADGGQTWTSLQIGGTAEEDYELGFDFHLNHIAASSTGRLYIAAEAGTLYRSDDRGRTWSVLPSPYEGSFFGALPLDGDSLLLFGLRGHLYRSDDAGASWKEIDSSTEALLTGGLRLADGTILVAGLSGKLLVSHDGGSSFSLLQQADRQGLARVVETDDGALVLVGEYGVRRVDVPRAEPGR